VKERHRCSILGQSNYSRVCHGSTMCHRFLARVIELNFRQVRDDPPRRYHLSRGQSLERNRLFDTQRSDCFTT
jgi:hypothetical protein